MQLSFADAVKEGSDRFRLIIYGAFFEIWNAALVDRQVWQGVPGVVEVVRVADRSSLDAIPADARTRSVIIPLGEDHYSEAPNCYLSLMPDARALATLRNKVSFAAYVDRLGLSKFCPKSYRCEEEIEYPCVLKRSDLAGGMGIELVRSKAQLVSLRETPMFHGRETLLQAFVGGATEYVTHCVCKDGLILWSCTFAWDLGRDTQFGIPVFGATIPVSASRRTMSAIAALLAPLRYSGPCCVNYKLLSNGEIAIFEINPRLGGSLINPRNSEFLRQAMAHIIHNAD